MPLNYDSTLERMLWAARLKNTSALALDLGVTPQALSNYKLRGQMPPELVIRFAEKHKLSIDWLIHGDDATYGVYQPTPSAPGTLTTETLSPDELVAAGKLLKILRSSDALKIALLALLDSAGREETLHFELSALSPDFPADAAKQIADAIDANGGRP